MEWRDGWECQVERLWVDGVETEAVGFVRLRIDMIDVISAGDETVQQMPSIGRFTIYFTRKDYLLPADRPSAYIDDFPESLYVWSQKLGLLKGRYLGCHFHLYGSVVMRERAAGQGANLLLPDDVDPSDVVNWERATLSSEGLHAYHDWCEERGWTEQAEVIRRRMEYVGMA